MKVILTFVVASKHTGQWKKIMCNSNSSTKTHGCNIALRPFSMSWQHFSPTSDAHMMQSSTVLHPTANMEIHSCDIPKEHANLQLINNSLPISPQQTTYWKPYGNRGQMYAHSAANTRFKCKTALCHLQWWGLLALTRDARLHTSQVMLSGGVCVSEEVKSAVSGVT